MIELLKLIEALSANITPDNIGQAIALIEKLITLAESMKQGINQASK